MKADATVQPLPNGSTGGGKDSAALHSVTVTMASLEEEWVVVGGAPTFVVKLGPKPQPGQPLFLIIPGNPGVADYYDDFMWTLYSESKHSICIWCVSHAGHVTVPSSAPSSKPREDLYNIAGQTKHKLTFIQNHVPADTPLILLGHSIGAYIILQLMKQLPSSQILQGVLLFPTIERMRTSPKGLSVTPFLRYFRWVAPLPVYGLYYFMPLSLQRYLARWYFRNQSIPDCAIKATLRLVDPSVVSNVLYMGKTEMESVVDADHDVIRANVHKLMFYYGKNDPWCPVNYCTEMRNMHPTADIKLCEQNFEHAFCLESSKEMAAILWGLMAAKLPITGT